MDSRLLIVAAAAVVVAIAALFLSNANQSTAQGAIAAQAGNQAKSTPASPQQSANPSSNAILFNSTPYVQYSYLISDPSLSQQAQSALAGFKLVRTPLQNGSVEINISLSANNQANSVILAPGYKMYVVETTFGDDGYGFDSSLGDDGFIIVNSTGYIV